MSMCSSLGTKRAPRALDTEAAASAIARARASTLVVAFLIFPFVERARNARRPLMHGTVVSPLGHVRHCSVIVLSVGSQGHGKRLPRVFSFSPLSLPPLPERESVCVSRIPAYKGGRPRTDTRTHLAPHHDHDHDHEDEVFIRFFFCGLGGPAGVPRPRGREVLQDRPLPAGLQPRLVRNSDGLRPEPAEPGERAGRASQQRSQRR
mmetsp:Transcript_3065/g.8367  ORF Transcript_3065/g.8367 Transcript_3065/m.8367 type:complete len:206 (+) Transcript_3065:419-1036(+)